MRVRRSVPVPMLLLAASGCDTQSSEAFAWLWAVAAVGIVAAVALGLFYRSRSVRSVFVSYRRSDSADQTARLVGSLSRRFGRRGVFRDVVSIEAGQDFRRVISRAV